MHLFSFSKSQICYLMPNYFVSCQRREKKLDFITWCIKMICCESGSVGFYLCLKHFILRFPSAEIKGIVTWCSFIVITQKTSQLKQNIFYFITTSTFHLLKKNHDDSSCCSLCTAATDISRAAAAGCLQSIYTLMPSSL